MKMRVIMLVLTLITGIMGGAASAADPDKAEVAITLDGVPVRGDAAPVIRDGRTLVPVRFIAEALGLKVTWNGATRQATIEDGKGKNILLTVDQPGVVVDGNQVFLDVPATILNGRTYVPLRFVGEALGLDVSWDATSRTVSLVRKSGGSADAASEPKASPPEPKMDSIEGVAGRLRMFFLTHGMAQGRATYQWDGSEIVQTVPLGPMGELSPEGVVTIGGREYKYRIGPKGIEFPDGGPTGLSPTVEAVQQRLIRLSAFLPLAYKYAGAVDCPGGARLEAVEPERPAGLPADAPPLVPFTGTGTAVVCPGEGVLNITADGTETVGGKPVALRSEIVIEPARQPGAAR